MSRDSTPDACIRAALDRSSAERPCLSSGSCLLPLLPSGEGNDLVFVFLFCYDVFVWKAGLRGIGLFG